MTLNEEAAEALRNEEKAEVLTTVHTTMLKSSFYRERTDVTSIYYFLEVGIVLNALHSCNISPWTISL